jgi:signal transduction histidine kinase
MFRPIPEATLFRRIPCRLIASVLLILALVVSVILLFSLEQEKLLLQGFTQGKTVPTELFPALWQSRSYLIVVTLLVFLVSAIGIAAVITVLHYDNTRSTLEEVKGLARNILQSIPTGILTLNRSGVLTAVNPMAEAVLKRPSAELLGHSYESIFSEGETIRSVLHGALRFHRHVSQQDLPYESQDRTPHTIRVSTAELTGDDGQSAGVILQAQDVTQWLALEHSQVLVNIVVNAFYAMPDGGLCRIVARERKTDTQHWLEFAVTDNDVGIRKEDLSRLFEPFYTTKSSGTGLGLAIAYRIMQDHGGTIQVSSIPRSGTTVVVQLPVAVGQPQEVAVES